MSSNRSNELPDKQAISLAFLEQTSVYLHLDPRRPGVQVPVAFTKQPQLVLQVGLNMPVPIADLRVEDAGISCTLSFNRTPHYCVVPWSAIFAMVGEDGRGMVWPDDVPAEVAAQVSVAQPKPTPIAVVPNVRDEPARAHGAAPKVATVAKSARAAAAKKKREALKALKAALPAGSLPEKAPPKRAAKAPAKPVAQAPAAQQRAPVTQGTKRQLPPYLRIIK